MLRADEILKKQFPATKFREGYEASAVDDFLDTVTETLRRYESGTGRAPDSLTADQVTVQKFAATKFRAGYGVDAVDDFLDEITATLRGWESGAAGAPVPAEPGVSLDALVTELQRSMVLSGAQRSLPVLVEMPDGRRLAVHDVVVVDGHAVVRVG
ncbi:DivIVA domain-containing protein [Sanguibacter gelidistatuariae]|uniref:DivIVA domain-containing protein n=1 Tax=Sanguibacter gelidistatuariae TaxID=1814289 RepID=A0A1G6GZJ2_9MICO|nr:DivIVA domain-containing protein [Sanguibacter gelidistatuariae]SDB87318.1 DivIVA domain-containing protein [Sanguibacter gelidistatuariae]